MATKALLTSEDLERIQSSTHKNFELIRGELYEIKPPNFRHGMIALEIGGLIRDWNRQARRGKVAVESGYTLERRPDTVRGPDVSFVSRGRIGREQARKGFPDLAPDLAVEVRSPSNTWEELREKAAQFMAAGTRLLWLVEPDQFVEVLRPGREAVRLGLDGEINGEDVLPGFSCRVRDFFPPEDD
ncbi:MAG TPA: Uma2 family endonuclease [Chloroflexota bacterium]|nr:Uma2 family endonuclease [Chloroflexota bacterium]